MLFEEIIILLDKEISNTSYLIPDLQSYIFVKIMKVIPTATSCCV